MRRPIALLAVAWIMGACAQATTTSLTTGATPTTTTPPASTTLPAFPPAREDLSQGDSTWAVVLAGAANPDDPAIQAASQAASAAGYTAGWTDCDEGAAEALGLPGGSITVSVYFESEAHARAAATAFEARGTSGVVAEVRTFCLD
ncbi:MAG TPA: hypothetical protein VID03_00785 [Acidimicrobiia bacterium]